jgi:hypothetical protein
MSGGSNVQQFAIDSGVSVVCWSAKQRGSVWDVTTIENLIANALFTFFIFSFIFCVITCLFEHNKMAYKFSQPSCITRYSTPIESCCTQLCTLII